MLPNRKLIDGFSSLKKQLDSTLKDYQCQGSHLQNYLYFTYAPVFSYTEAVIILCKNKKFNAAGAILRSLIEVHINIIYHQLGDQNKKLAISARDRFVELKKVFSDVSMFIKKYPIHESEDTQNLFNKEYLSRALEYIESSIKNIENSNYLNDEDIKLPLLEKARKNDEVKVTGAEKGHFQRIYTMIYRQLSASVHLDILGLENFSKINSKRKYAIRENCNGNVLIGQAIDICVALTKDLYENKVIVGNLPQIVHDLQKLLVSK